MRWREHLWAWVNHAALNLGQALCCLWHIALPPQVDHKPETVVSLSRSNPAREFFVGLDGAGWDLLVALIATVSLWGLWSFLSEVFGFWLEVP